VGILQKGRCKKHANAIKYDEVSGFDSSSTPWQSRMPSSILYHPPVTNFATIHRRLCIVDFFIQQQESENGGSNPLEMDRNQTLLILLILRNRTRETQLYYYLLGAENDGTETKMGEWWQIRAIGKSFHKILKK
jgi:hypothetical protein